MLAATAAWAADNVDGKWSAQVGQTQLTLELKADDEKLTGKVARDELRVKRDTGGAVQADEFVLKRSK